MEYEKEFKVKIVNEYKKCRNIQQILDRYAVSRASLYAWLKLYRIQIGGWAKKINFTYKDLLSLKTQLKCKTRELEIIEKAHCFKDSPRQQKLEAAERLHGEFSTRELCRVLDLDRGTFLNHHYRKVKVTMYEKQNEFLRPHIKRVFEESNHRFGIIKILQKLRMEGIKVARKKVSELYKEMGLKSKHQRKHAFIPKQGAYTHLENKLNKNFNQTEPNKFWVSDITKIWVGMTLFNLCVIIDLFSRKVIAHNVSSKNDNQLTINTFRNAFESRGRPSDLTFHSDQGVNYTSPEFCSLLRSMRVTQSFSRKGNPYDNAVAEAFFSRIKREELNSHNFEYFDELEICVDRFIEFYNDYRTHDSLKNKTPNQVESEFYN